MNEGEKRVATLQRYAEALYYEINLWNNSCIELQSEYFSVQFENDYFLTYSRNNFLFIKPKEAEYKMQDPIIFILLSAEFLRQQNSKILSEYLIRFNSNFSCLFFAVARNNRIGVVLK